MTICKVKPFPYNTGIWRTEFLYQYRAPVCWRATKVAIIRFGTSYLFL